MSEVDSFLSGNSLLSRGFYSVVRALLHGIFLILTRVKVYGKENIPSHGPFVLAPVHRSNVDTPLVSTVTHRRMRLEQCYLRLVVSPSVVARLIAKPCHAVLQFCRQDSHWFCFQKENANQAQLFSRCLMVPHMWQSKRGFQLFQSELGVPKAL